MFSNPFYNLHSSYYDPADYYGGPYYARQRRALAQQQALEHQRAQRRAEMLRRAKYLPDEDDDISDDDWAFRDALERHRADERRRQEQKIINERRQEQEKLEQLAREQEERRRECLRQAHRQRQNRPQQPPPCPPSRSQSPEHPIQTSSETLTSLQRSPSPTAEPVESKDNIEEQNKAATRIQTAFRVHSTLAALKSLAAQFDALRNSFTLPTVIDFQGPQGIVSVSVRPGSTADTSDTNTPKLAFNQTNYALHSYTESLNRLLIKLDGVESWGNGSVRKIRRGIVGRVEQEASRLEAYWKQAWAAYVADTE